MHHVHELEHPLADHNLRYIRDRDTDSATFRRCAQRLSGLLLAEASRELPTQEVQVPTPVETTSCREIQERIALVPILRAGLVMVEPSLTLLPNAEVWHLGYYRDEDTLLPVSYYDKLPAGQAVDTAFVLDPMLATGGSACAALETLTSWGVTRTIFLGILAAPEGIQRLHQEFPQTAVYVAAIDERLNENGYIVPGLGDAGDRAFNATAK